MLSAELAIATPNQRSAARTKMRLASAFTVDQSSRCLCRITDLSATGARLELFNEVARDSEIELRLPGGLVRLARVMWARGLAAGCVFDEPLPDDAIAALAEAYGLDRADPFLSRTGRA